MVEKVEEMEKKSNGERVSERETEWDSGKGGREKGIKGYEGMLGEG